MAWTTSTSPIPRTTAFEGWIPREPSSTFAGTGRPGFSGDNGPAIAAQLNSPTSVAVDGTAAASTSPISNHRIRRVDPSGTISTFAGTVGSGFSGDNGPAVAAWLRYPIGVTVDGLGNVHIADTENHRIRILTQASSLSTLQSPRN